MRKLRKADGPRHAVVTSSIYGNRSYIWISDPVFASRVKSLRLHYNSEEGDTLDVILCTWFRILYFASQH